MTFASDDFDGQYCEIDVVISYSCNRESKTLRSVAVCKKSGLISARTTARPEHGIEAGWNCVINSGECDRLGITPWQAMRDQAPVSCLLRLGENPGGITVTELVSEPLNTDRKTSLDSIERNIAAQHGECVAGCWRQHGSSEKADESEDEFCAQRLREAGY